jgi:hypothetical protein
MKYTELDRVWFDAIVTGELTHYALWFEEQLEFLVMAFFLNDHRVIELFSMTFLRSRDFTMAKKTEFVKTVLKGWDDSRSGEFLSAIKDMEEIIAIRNAMAHGRDVGGTGLSLSIEIVSHGGKAKTIEITPESHEQIMDTAERCLDKLKELKLLGPNLRS